MGSKCLKCNSKRYKRKRVDPKSVGYIKYKYTCLDCGGTWFETNNAKGSAVYNGL